MATIYKEIELEQAADFVWDRLRDFGALSERPRAGLRHRVPARRTKNRCEW